MRSIGFVASFCFALAASSGSPIWTPGEDGVTCYRIPVAFTASSTSVHVFAEARRLNCGDAGPKDIVMKVADGGQGWSASQKIVSDPANASSSYDGVNLGAVTVFDETNVVLHYLACGHRCKQSFLYTVTSTDGGKTWSEPQNLTEALIDADLALFAPGPSTGTQMLSHGGRIVVAGWYRAHDGELGSTVVFSDDKGATWQFGGRVANGGSGSSAVAPNEASVVETSGGELLLNMRDNAGDTSKQRSRLLARSSDGGETWSAPQHAADLPDPGCQGMMLASSSGTIFFSNADDGFARANGTLKASEDGGQTWQLVDSITGPSETFGYSAIVEIPQYTTGKEDIGIAYEDSGSPEGISWQNWLQNDDDNIVV